MSLRDELAAIDATEYTPAPPRVFTAEQEQEFREWQAGLTAEERVTLLTDPVTIGEYFDWQALAAEMAREAAADASREPTRLPDDYPL
jgi:hypothetical protein